MFNENALKGLMVLREKIAAEIAEVATQIQRYERCPKTVKGLLDISQEVKAETPDFEALNSNYLSLYGILEKEFAEITLLEYEFRKKCFEEIRLIIQRVLQSQGPGYLDTVGPITKPLAARMEDIEKNLVPVTNFLWKLAEEPGDIAMHPQQKKVLRFHLKAYLYVVLIEGVFDDLVRLLYYLERLSEKETEKLSDLETTETKILLRLMDYHRCRPSFLNDGEMWCYWRNAIAHANAHYDYETDMIHFGSVKPLTPEEKPYEWSSMADLDAGVEKLVYSSAAYRLNMLLVSVFWSLYEAKHESSNR
jgi:hypothetical protein